MGLLYRHGYFTQSLSPEGWQTERYPASDPNGLPLTLLRAPDGTAVRVSVALAEGKLLSAQIWVAQVGRVPLLLLDSYVEENEPALREVTDRLYGGGGDHRLRQELLLGIGGVRAVRAFCALTRHAEPEVFHTNEGHAGFLGVERIREYAEQGLSFEEAIELCRAGTVFTTHTPVPAGIDRFSRDLVERHFTGAAADPALPLDRVLALGAETFPGGDPSVFNMAVMGMRLAQRVNGVSLLHGEVSREMFAGLWPGFDTAQVPIGSITNGVHAPTWVAQEVLDLASGAPEDSAVAQQLPEDGHAWERVAHTAPARLWEIRRALRSRLVTLARQRLRASWRQRGRQRRGTGLDRRGPRRRRADHRLRPPGALLQAADADAARPGPADRAAARPGPAGAAGHRGQGAPRRRRRQAADPADGPVRRRPAGAPPHRVPPRLRHGHGAAAGPGL